MASKKIEGSLEVTNSLVSNSITTNALYSHLTIDSNEGNTFGYWPEAKSQINFENSEIFDGYKYARIGMYNGNEDVGEGVEHTEGSLRTVYANDINDFSYMMDLGDSGFTIDHGETTDLVNDENYFNILTADKDNIETGRDVNLNGHSTTNAGKSESTYYGSSKYYWIKLIPQVHPTSGNKDTLQFYISLVYDSNQAQRCTYLLNIGTYRTSASAVRYSVSLINLGNLAATSTLSSNDLAVAIGSDGYVYIQARQPGYFRINELKNSAYKTTYYVKQTYARAGQEAFGTANGFTSLTMIKDYGYMQVDNGTVTSPTYATKLYSQYFVEDGTLLQNKYLKITDAQSNYQPLNTKLTNIAGLGSTTGYLKKTGANTWSVTNPFTYSNGTLTVNL